MERKVEIPEEQLKELLRQNKQMKYDLFMVVNIAGEAFEMIQGGPINMATAMIRAPRIIAAIQEDAEKTKFLEATNIQRLKTSYANKP